jgi:hypothetical protein
MKAQLGNHALEGPCHKTFFICIFGVDSSSVDLAVRYYFTLYEYIHLQGKLLTSDANVNFSTKRL